VYYKQQLYSKYEPPFNSVEELLATDPAFSVRPQANQPAK